MAVNWQRYSFITLLLGCAAVSEAGMMDRLWGQKDDVENQLNECESLSKAQQQQLISTYQKLNDEEKKLNLKKRLEWFCNLPAEDQQRLRQAWQNMNMQERHAVKVRLEQTEDAEQRAAIRQEVMDKYAPVHSSNTH